MFEILEHLQYLLMYPKMAAIPINYIFAEKLKKVGRQFFTSEAKHVFCDEIRNLFGLDIHIIWDYGLFSYRDFQESRKYDGCIMCHK